jgi:hypothetical protein
MRSQDMKYTVNKKVPTKSFIPQGCEERNFPHNSWTRKDKTYDENQRELRIKKKLFFSCKYPWEPGHMCMGKGKFH